ncbi:uncharacterized protein LOC101744818 [Bombyx mori]|uniref:Uncharacterized protein n=1 Tax=Bombyx mori TaxID=7091 RepID=A0A8R2DND1_BOMMO|nr:uncharacterized protein LOC101744818 [Bombyx mori]XP_021208150.1 uncharacterized protein LOC101744818 [Bombyx mori]XP_037876549.1 uncharacterized protein LOC101744818 [Bombyx mori]
MSSNSDSSLELIEDGSPHSLLEPPSPDYTNVTIRRAFIVWMLCGQKNKFRDVCNYYHRLELLEEQLPPNKRATSRHYEFNMINNPPPKSSYLKAYFPTLYPGGFAHAHDQTDTHTNERCEFNIGDLDEIKKREGITTEDVVQASVMIRNYCKSHAISLDKFLVEFKDIARKTNLKINVNNVVFYIRRRLVAEELKLALLCPRTMHMLDEDSSWKHVKDITKLIRGKIQVPKSLHNDMIQKKLKILTENMKIENELVSKKGKNDYYDINDIFSNMKKQVTPVVTNVFGFNNYSQKDSYKHMTVQKDSYKHITVDDLMKNYNKIGVGSNHKYTFMNMTKFGRN